MPSPFPGMDPYLEERSLWPDIHIRLINNIAEALQVQVRPKYVARIGERIELAELRRGYIPDVMLVEPPRLREAALAYAGPLVADEPQTMAFLDEERRVPYLEIIYRETGDVVTLIEVLSPANKVGEGRKQYLQKQAELLNTQANLVEIDLLSGSMTTLARAFEIRSPQDWRYMVNISRPHQRSQLEIYAIPLRDRLPRCRIPLRPEDADVVLDLPAVFTRCYDVGGYDLLIDYQKAPPVALNPDENAWLTNLLDQKGIRHAKT